MSHSILVIEDAPNWQQQLAEILRDEGYTVEIAGDYLAALRQLRHNNFDALVVDLRLSDSETDCSGMELLGDAYDREIPAIIVTGYGTPELAQEAYHSYGVYDFISKYPFSSDDFRESVRHAIAARRARRQPAPLTPEQRKIYDETIRKLFRGEPIEFR